MCQMQPCADQKISQMGRFFYQELLLTGIRLAKFWSERLVASFCVSYILSWFLTVFFFVLCVSVELI